MTPCLFAALIATATTIAAPLQTPAAPPNERIILANGDAAMAQALSGRWTVTEIAAAPVAAGVDVWIEITDDSIAGVSGCNNFSATLEVSGSELALGPVASTRKACPRNQMDTEQTFLRALDRVNGFAIDADGTLTLSGFGTPLLVATRQ